MVDQTAPVKVEEQQLRIDGDKDVKVFISGPVTAHPEEEEIGDNKIGHSGQDDAAAYRPREHSSPEVGEHVADGPGFRQLQGKDEPEDQHEEAGQPDREGLSSVALEGVETKSQKQRR